MKLGTCLRLNSLVVLYKRTYTASYATFVLDRDSIVLYVGEAFDDDKNPSNKFLGDKMHVFVTQYGLGYVYDVMTQYFATV